MKVFVEISEKDYEDFKLQAGVFNKLFSSLRDPSVRAKYAIGNGIPVIEQKEAAAAGHGVWLDCAGASKCSVCGFCVDDQYYLGFGRACPNCGVPMDPPYCKNHSLKM